MNYNNRNLFNDLLETFCFSGLLGQIFVASGITKDGLSSDAEVIDLDLMSSTCPPVPKVPFQGPGKLWNDLHHSARASIEIIYFCVLGAIWLFYHLGKVLGHNEQVHCEHNLPNRRQK